MSSSVDRRRAPGSLAPGLPGYGYVLHLRKLHTANCKLHAFDDLEQRVRAQELVEDTRRAMYLYPPITNEHHHPCQNRHEESLESLRSTVHVY